LRPAPDETLIRTIALLLGVGMALYGVFVGGLYAFQRRLIYVPNTSPPVLDQLGIAGARAVEVVTKDGLRLLAWYVAPPPGRPVIVYFHGNAGNLNSREGRFARFAAAGFGALFLEYRGYGGNPGSPTEAGLFLDGHAAVDFLTAQNIPPERIVLFGESLGTGVAVQVASERPAELPIGAVVLEAPYSSIADVAQRRYPLVPVRRLIKDKFDSMAQIAAVRAPVLVLLAGRDVVVPPEFGQALFDAAAEPKQLWVAAEAGHENLREFGALDVAEDFIRRYVSDR
jgi:uncharacterized protein